MNILMLIHNQSGSGPYHKVLEMCEALNKSGNTITLVCTSKSNRFIPSFKMVLGIKVIESPDLLSGKLRQGLDIWNVIIRCFLVGGKKIDIVHAIDCRPVVILPAMFLKVFRRKPLVISWWDLFGRGGTALERSGSFYNKTFGYIESFFEEKFRKFADRATVVSVKLYNNLLQLGYDERKVKLIRIGCNVPLIPFYDQGALKKTLNLRPDTTVFIYIGSIFKKDLDLLISALYLLKEKIQQMPQTVIIGNHSIDNDTCKDLEIVLLARIENREILNQYLMVSDFGLLPFTLSESNAARWPSKAADYWAFGLPVVATPISDYRQLFSEFNLGLLSDNDLPNDFSNEIRRAMDMGIDEKNEKRKSVQDFVKSNLDWPILTKQLSNLYSELV